MSSKRTTWAALSLLVVLATVLAACGPAATPQVIKETELVKETQIVKETQVVKVAVTATPEPFKPQGTLTIGLTTNVDRLEQPYAPERQSSNASWTLFDSLIFPEQDGTFSPSLAESWDVSEDGRTYTFHLRQGVTFHNGEQFNADSVVFSYETYKQPEVTYASNWTIADAVEKVDEYAVNVSTKEPNALLLPYIATAWSMIPPKYYQEVGAEGFAEKPVGTGPWMLEEWVKGSHLTVVANPNYWRPNTPKLEKVVFKFLPESATRVAAIQTGELDIAPRLTSDDVKPLLGLQGVTIIRYPVNRSYYMAYNNVSTGIGTPIEDPKVRQAIAYAVDVQAIIDSLFEGYATRSVGFVGPQDLGFDGAEPVAYDPEKAKQLLTDAGYPNGFKVDMSCPDGAYSHINEVCEAIRGYLDAVGITGDLNIMESNAYWDLEAKQQLPPLFVDAWSVQLTEAYPRLQGALDKGESYAAWYSDDIKALLDKIITTVDTTERAKLYGDLQKLMREDPPFLYLYYPEAFEGVTTRVVDYRPGSAEQYWLRDVSVSD